MSIRAIHVSPWDACGNEATGRCVASCKLRTRSLHYCITANLEYPKGSEESTSGTKTSRTTATYRQTEMSPQEPTRHTYSGGGVVPKLNGINSFTWKMEVYNVAVLNGFADVLIGTKSRAGLTQWESQNQKARALLLRSVDEMFHWQLIDKETASDAWTYLAEVHSLTRRSTIRLLQIELYNLYLDENGDMEEHLRRFGSLVARGRQVDMEEFLTDTETCANFIRSLPYRLKTEISQAWSRLPLEDQTVSHLISLYLEEMCSKRVYAAKLAASVALKASAQGTSGGGNNGRRNGRGNGGPNGGTGNY